MVTVSMLVVFAIVALAAAWWLHRQREAPGVVWSARRWASRADPIADELIRQHGVQRPIYDTFDPTLRQRADRRRRQAERVRRRAAAVDVGVAPQRKRKAQPDTRQIRLISGE